MNRTVAAMRPPKKVQETLPAGYLIQIPDGETRHYVGYYFDKDDTGLDLYRSWIGSLHGPETGAIFPAHEIDQILNWVKSRFNVKKCTLIPVYLGQPIEK